MTTDDGATHVAVAGSPVLLVVDADPKARAVTESALARRFGSDYRVLTADAPQAGLDTLARLAERGEQVALLVAMEPLPHPHSLQRTGDATASDRAWPNRLLDGEGMGHPRGVAVPPGPGGTQRLDDGEPAEPRGLPDRW